MAGMLEYKCPCCDGAIQFDSATQKMKCPYCDTEFDVDALKGYDHYPCLRKLMRFARSMDDGASDYDLMIVCTVLSQIAQAATIGKGDQLYEVKG